MFRYNVSVPSSRVKESATKKRYGVFTARYELTPYSKQITSRAYKINRRLPTRKVSFGRRVFNVEFIVRGVTLGQGFTEHLVFLCHL
jgi:hypothetical protein